MAHEVAYPGGAVIGSAIRDGFQKVWEGETRRLIFENVPSICPHVCDPFKSRANELLEIAEGIALHEGLSKLYDYVDDLVGKGAYSIV